MNKVAQAEELARHLVFLHERHPERFDTVYGAGLLEKARAILEPELKLKQVGQYINLLPQQPLDPDAKRALYGDLWDLYS